MHVSLPNPMFSPELQAKTTLIDFTVTQKGLEEQLLGRVIGKEQKALEVVDQDKLERLDTQQWRQLLVALCFLHSIVQERRKCGSLMWFIPYEYNNGDLQSCMLFLEKHLYNGPIRCWPLKKLQLS